MAKKYFLLILAFLLFTFSGCESETDKSPNSFSEEDIIPYNFEIDPKDISFVSFTKTICTEYKYAVVEITNSGSEEFYLGNAYRLYEKTEDGYILIDSRSENKNSGEDKIYGLIESGKTQKEIFSLECITDGEFSKVGEYKIEIPFNNEVCLSAEFKIIDEPVSVDKGIALELPKDRYSAESDEDFYFTVKNNSENDFGVTFGLIISRYENGEWVRLPVIGRYDDREFSELTSSEVIFANTEHEQKIYQSLAEIVDAELTPGKYRLEKELYWDWYFAEFDIY